jgi:hypothetical protein
VEREHGRAWGTIDTVDPEVEMTSMNLDDLDEVSDSTIPDHRAPPEAERLQLPTNVDVNELSQTEGGPRLRLYVACIREGVKWRRARSG